MAKYMRIGCFIIVLCLIFLGTNSSPEGISGAKVLGKDELVVSNSKYLNKAGDINWEKYAPNGGYVEGTRTTGNTLSKGTIIDRYGNEYGRYTSPVGTSYTKRSLPYIENPNAYHKYKIVEPINNVAKGEIAKAFRQTGGGIQYELPKSINDLKKLGWIKEVK